MQCLFLYRYHGPRSLGWPLRTPASKRQVRVRATITGAFARPNRSRHHVAGRQVSLPHFRAFPRGPRSLRIALPPRQPDGERSGLGRRRAGRRRTRRAASRGCAGLRKKARRLHGRGAAIADAEESGADRLYPPGGRSSAARLARRCRARRCRHRRRQNGQSTRTMPAASSPASSTASMSRPSPRPTRRLPRRKNSSIAATISCSSTPPAETLLKLSDWAKGKDVLFFNIRATDVSLRQEDCRANVMHVVPDRYMLADALAQYLVVKKWTNWLLVYGSTPGDLAYADAIKRAAVALRRQYRRRARIQGHLRRAPRRCRHHSARQAGEQRRGVRRQSRLSGHRRRRRGSVVRPVYALSRRRRCAARSPAPPASPPRPGARATRNGARPR